MVIIVAFPRIEFNREGGKGAAARGTIEQESHASIGIMQTLSAIRILRSMDKFRILDESPNLKAEPLNELKFLKQHFQECMNMIMQHEITHALVEVG